MRKIITAIIVVAFAINNAGQGYALRPMAAVKSDLRIFKSSSAGDVLKTVDSIRISKEIITNRLKKHSKAEDEWLGQILEYIGLIDDILQMGYMVDLEKFRAGLALKTRKLKLLLELDIDGIEPISDEINSFYTISPEELQAMRSFQAKLKNRFNATRTFYVNELDWSEKYFNEVIYRDGINLYEAAVPVLSKMLKTFPRKEVDFISLQLAVMGKVGTYLFLKAIDEGNLYDSLREYYEIFSRLPDPTMFKSIRLASRGFNYTYGYIPDLEESTYSSNEIRAFLTSQNNIILKLAFGDNKRDIWAYIEECMHKTAVFSINGFLLADSLPQLTGFYNKDTKQKLTEHLHTKYGISTQATLNIIESLFAENVFDGIASFQVLEKALSENIFKGGGDYIRLLEVICKAAKSSSYIVLSQLFSFKDIDKPWVDTLSSFCNALKGKAIIVVFKYLKSKHFDLLESFSENEFDYFFTLLTKITVRYGNRAGLIINGILDSAANGSRRYFISKTHEEDIFRFCDEMYCFIDILFELYQRYKGDKERWFIDTMHNAQDLIRHDKLDFEAIKILLDSFELEDIFAQHKFLLALYFTVIPPRDTSFLSIDDATDRLIWPSVEDATGLKVKKPIDTREHIPPALVGYERSVTFARLAYSKKNVGIDHSQEIDKWLQRLIRSDDSEQSIIDEDRLKKVILQFFSGQLSSDVADLKNAVEAYVRGKEEFQKRLEEISGEQDYYKKIARFSNFINTVLVKELRALIKQVVRPKKDITPQKKKGWSSLMQQLSSVRLDILEEKILPDKTPQTLERIQGILEDAVTDVDRRMAIEVIINRLLASEDMTAYNIQDKDIIEEAWGGVHGERTILRVALDNFSKDATEKTPVTFKVVKGLPYVMYGMNCGVCVAGDYSVWENENFFLLAIYDDNTGLVEGFVQLYSYTLSDGSRALVVLGVNPTFFFEDTIYRNDDNALRAFHRELYGTIHEIKRLGNYSAVYVPTATETYSNSYAMKKVFKEITRGHQPIKLEEPIVWAKDQVVESVFEMSEQSKPMPSSSPTLITDKLQKFEKAIQSAA